MDDSFSTRHNLQKNSPKIEIRWECPQNIREGLISIARYRVKLSPDIVYTALCKLRYESEVRNPWPDDDKTWVRCESQINSAEWFEVYDFVECLFEDVNPHYDQEIIQKWEVEVNRFFEINGVGWKLKIGKLITRGDDAFERTVKQATTNLKKAQLLKSRSEIEEALYCISRRPKANLTGAVRHCMAALECTLREVTGNRKPTLGDLLSRNQALFPGNLAQTLEKLWGYSCEYARHAREDRSLSRPEVELLVSISAACCSYLSEKIEVKTEHINNDDEELPF